MHRDCLTKPNTDKSGPGTYRVGEFLISRIGSRWRVSAQHIAPIRDFGTLGGAIAWCRQQAERVRPGKINLQGS
jgi:hypothetical protein